MVVPKWIREENSEEWRRRVAWIDSRLLSPVGVRLYQADKAERKRIASSPEGMLMMLLADILAKRTTSDPWFLFLPSGSIGNFWRSAKETVVGGSEDSIIRSLPVCAFIANLKSGPQPDLSSGRSLPWWMRMPSVVDSLAGVSSGEEFDIITAAFG